MSGLAGRERAIRQRLKDDFPHYAARCLKIRTKTGRIAPLVLNRVQLAFHAKVEAQRARTGRVRMLVLKARQPGISTYVAARFFWRVTHRRGVRAFILTHKDDATSNLFGMAKRFYDHCPAPVKPALKAANAKELDFGRLDSGYRVGTAKAEGVGRSDTIQYFHGSEVAFWPNAASHATGALQAVPDAEETEIILESTGNGLGGLFYDKCLAAEQGQGDFELAFIGWQDHEEYRAVPLRGWEAPPAFAEYRALHGLDEEQTYWAFKKNQDMAIAIAAPDDLPCWKFRQEYPATAQEAFQAGGADSLIRGELILKARQESFPEPDARVVPLVLGVDVARGGGDKTRLIDRYGRRYGHNLNRTIDSADLMAVAGAVAQEIERLKPDRVFIDATGGYGAAVYDRLVELGYRMLVTPVEFGGRALKPEHYANKRAEIWALLRDDFAREGGVDLVDDETLHRHLAAPGYGFDSAGRLQLERKEEIKKRLGFSPDGGDAAALTHAGPVRKLSERPTARAQAQGGYSVHRW